MEHACHRRRILAFRHHSGVKQVAPLYPTSSSLESGGSMMSDYLSGNRREPFCGNAMQVIRFPKLNIHIWLVLWFSVSMLPPLRAESPMQGAPIETMLRIPASRFQNRSREQLSIDLRRGIGPDDAATIALYSNPALRAIRDRRGLAVAQLIQARILPNVVVSYARDYVTGGNTAGATTAYNFTAGWEFSALVPFLPKQTAARKNLGSVDLDIAWQEWQIAANAGTGVYRVLGLDAQTRQAREANRGLQESTDAMRKALEAHDLAAVEASSQDSRATMLSLEQDFEHQRLGLNKILGVQPETHVRLRSGLTLPTHLEPPDEADLLANIESRRLDLLGLRQGYQSQDATVRAAILAQFPKLSLAFTRAGRTVTCNHCSVAAELWLVLITSLVDTQLCTMLLLFGHSHEEALQFWNKQARPG